MNRYLLADNGPGALAHAAFLAFFAWLLVGGFLIWSWSKQRRFAWLASLAWAVLTLTAIKIIVATGPTPIYSPIGW